MEKKYLTYNEASKIAIKNLNSVQNIKKFCLENNIGYKNVIFFKNNPEEKQFPLLVCKILSIFGNDVTIKKVFVLNKKKCYGQNNNSG